jgi:acetyltransferase-like isoleucine patch superfamily enzyme
MSSHSRIKRIGKYTYGHDNVQVHYWGEGTWLSIGSFCSIAGNVQVFLGGNHRTDWVSTYPFGHIHQNTFNTPNGDGHPSTNGDVIIGNDVWVGANATIMSGLTIGDGAVIAAGAMVTKSVLPYTIVGGNPAKVLKKRFDQNIIDKLLEYRWWELDDRIIDHISPLLCSEDFDQLFTILEDIKKQQNNLN